MTEETTILPTLGWNVDRSDAGDGLPPVAKRLTYDFQRRRKLDPNELVEEGETVILERGKALDLLAGKGEAEEE